MAQRATSLVPKPSLFIIFCCFFVLFFLSKLCFFHLEKGILCLLLSVSLCFSLAFFGHPLFQFLFLCLSLYISLSLSLLFLSFFLPSCLSFLLYFGSLFLSLSFLLFLLCFCFMKGTTSKYSIAKCFFINLFSFFCFPVLFLFQIPFSYLCYFLISSYVFLFNINVFGFKKPKLKNNTFW